VEFGYVCINCQTSTAVDEFSFTNERKRRRLLRVNAIRSENANAPYKVIRYKTDKRDGNGRSVPPFISMADVLWLIKSRASVI